MTQSTLSPNDMPGFLKGEGGMKQRIAAFDWTSTALGPADAWPAPLKTALGILLNSDFPMHLMWGDNYIQFYNDAYSQLLGAERHPGILGRPARDTWAEVWPVVAPMIEKVYRNGECASTEDTLIPVLRNGKMEDVYWTFSYSPVYGDNEFVSGVLSVCTENTKQAENQKQVNASRQRFEQLVQQLPIAIAVLESEDLVVKVANEAILNIWQQSIDNVLNRRLLDFQPEIADQPFPRLLRNVLRTGETHEELGIVANLVNEKGEPRQYYLDLTYQRFANEEGEPNSILASVIDQTAAYQARKRMEESERHLRTMILNAPVAMCILRGPDHVMEVGNPMMFTLLGRSGDQLLGRPVFEASPEMANEGFQELLKQVMTSGQSFSFQEREVPLLRNGKTETVYVNFIYEPYRETEEEAVSGVIIVALDVTPQVIARRKIEEVVAERTQELAQANHFLQRSNQELEQFAYIASHDLQEPLRKVNTFAEMLSSALKDAEPKPRFYLEKITSATQRMTTLIRDVLNYSQLNSGERQYEKVALSNILAEVRTDLELLLEQKGATLVVEDLPVLPAIYLQMHQLFYNLVANSLKFTRPEAAPQITVSASYPKAEELSGMAELLPELQYCRIRVSDNGIGFSQEYAQQIFTIFKRLHSKEEFAGTGIGLALCKKIAVNHKGTIYAEGRLGEGADFFILLPLSQPKPVG